MKKLSLAKIGKIEIRKVIHDEIGVHYYQIRIGRTTVTVSSREYAEIIESIKLAEQAEFAGKGDDV